MSNAQQLDKATTRALEVLRYELGIRRLGRTRCRRLRTDCALAGRLTTRPLRPMPQTQNLRVVSAR